MSEAEQSVKTEYIPPARHERGQDSTQKKLSALGKEFLPAPADAGSQALFLRNHYFPQRGNDKIQKVSNWMMALSDYMIACPQATTKQAAKFFKRTPSYVSLVKNSDAFRDYHSRRHAEHSSLLQSGVKEKLETVAELSLDGIIENLEDEAEKTPKEFVEYGKLALNALGFSPKKHTAPSVAVQVNNEVQPAALEASRKALQDLRMKNDRSISAVTPVSAVTAVAKEED